MLTVLVEFSSYQYSNENLEIEFHFPTIPEPLANALGCKVNIKYED